jgi:UDPglucose 6-dehydrogenase
MRIAVVGLGYVGLSLAVLLSQKHEVTAIDIDPDKINRIIKKSSPIDDIEISSFLSTKQLDLKAVLSEFANFESQELIIIATPTHYDPSKNYFDTSIVENVIHSIIASNNNCLIVIKSTVPVGFTERIKVELSYEDIIFSPEFLREGKALYDNLYPSRIVVGGHTDKALMFGDLLKSCSLNHAKVLYTNSTEAEAIKLFSNTYLAMRIAFFNELDSYSEIRQLSTKNIIEGVCLDQRIGHYYNNPSFGYGGYCLPKDTKQLLANYRDVPQNLMRAIVDANQTRKNHIATMIINKIPKSVGIYRLTMKLDSDNFRESAVLNIIATLKNEAINVVIYEPLIPNTYIYDCLVINDFDTFIAQSDIIVANRMNDQLSSYASKIYTRDIFYKDC